MKIFLSHAHEQAPIADALAIALRQEGHTAFLDSDVLKAAEGYHEAIRNEIRASDLFVYLLSPQSLEPGSYALTELGVARERWPDPSSRVLPVVVSPVSFDLIPPYLKAVTVLQPKGDPVAETVARVAAIQRGTNRRRLIAAGGAAGIAAIAGGMAWRFSRSTVRCLIDAAVLERTDTVRRVTTLEAGMAGAIRTFVVTDGLASIDIDSLTGSHARWIIEASAANGEIVARFEVDGCPSAPLELSSNETGLRLRLSPRR